MPNWINRVNYSKAKIVEVRNAQRKRNYTATRPPGIDHKRRWSCEDAELLFTSTLSDRDLGIKLGRSVLAIQVKRCKEKIQ